MQSGTCVRNDGAFLSKVVANGMKGFLFFILLNFCYTDSEASNALISHNFQTQYSPMEIGNFEQGSSCSCRFLYLFVY